MQPGTEPRTPGPLANNLPTSPMSHNRRLLDEFDGNDERMDRVPCNQ